MVKCYSFPGRTAGRWFRAAWTLAILGFLTGTAGAQTFSSAGPHAITDFTTTSNQIAVSGVGTVSEVSVTITGLSHTWSGDVDMVLESPGGAASSMLFDNGGGSTDYSSNTYTFALTGGTFLGGGTPNGTYTASGSAFDGTGPAGTPAGMGNFTGVNGDGNWTLYWFDNGTGDAGSFTQWSLTFPLPPCDNVALGAQFPFAGVVAPTAGNSTLISAGSWAGDYFSINSVVSGQEYTLTSSDAGDYWTIRETTASGTVVFSGFTPLTFTPSSGATLWAHLNADEFCTFENVDRSTTISATLPPPPGCDNVALGLQFPFAGVVAPTAGNSTLISAGSWAGDYFSINSVVSGQEYTLTSSDAGDYWTIRETTASGTVVFAGFTPLTFTPSSGATLWAHLTADDLCTFENIDRTTTISATALPPVGCDNTLLGGQFPGTPTPAPTVGNTTQITSCSFAGEYSVITGVAIGQEYIASSSDAGDFITVRTGTSDGPILTSGTTPVSFTPSSTDNVYLHWSVDAGCGTENVCRITNIEAVLPPECDNTLAGGQFPGTPTPAPAPGNTTQITTCSFAGEYSQITGVASGQEYIASSSDAGDWITVRTGTSDGPVLTSGTTPLTFTTISADNLFLHWSVDSGCGTENVCRTTNIEATNVAPPVSYCGGPIAITDNTVTSSTVNVSGFGVTGPVSVEINNISHTWSGDVQVMLEGPGGQTVVLFSGLGGSADFTGNNITFVATGSPAYSGPASGTFTPQGSTTFGGGAPAPAGPHGSDLGIFTGSVADGDWTLWVFDSATGDSGTIGEWCIVPSAPPTFCGGGASITDNTTTVTTTNVSGFGVSGPIQVELYGLNHTWSGDVQVLLVGPLGQSAVLFSGLGGSADFTNTDLVFVPTGAPAYSGPVSGTYTPQGSTFFGGGAPAPAGPYGADLNAFTGTNVDGTWSLYFFDSATGDAGSLDSWCITPSYPPACGDPIVELVSACADEATFGFSTLIGSVSDYDWEVVPFGNAQGVGVITSGSGVSGATATGLTASTQYTLWVRTDCGLDGASAYVSFDFTSGLVNDCSQDAIVLSNPCAAAQPAVAGTTNGSQFEADYVPFNVNYGTIDTERGVWYLLPGDNQQYTISSCNPVSYDTRITVYTGTPGALTPIVANDDIAGCGFGPFRSEVTFNALTGTDYYIYIHGYQFLDFPSVTGDFELSFFCAPLCLPQPSNDDCASAISLSPLPTSCTPITVSTECASPAAVIPSCLSIFPTYNDVWYSFVATDPSQSFDLTLGTATDVSVAIYDACGGADVVCGASLPSGNYAIPFLTVGNTYLVQILSEASGAGTFDFCLYDGCPFPTGWAINNPTTEGFDLSWVDNAGVSSFDIYVAEVPATAPDEFTIPTFSGVAGSPFTLTGLNSGTQYQVWVRADCGGGSFSLWSGGLFGTTLTPPPGCGEQFFDTGGEFGDYANDENYVVTLTPDNAGERVRLTFTQFDVESGWDYMRIFNGPDETSPEFLSGYPGGIVAPPNSYTGLFAPTEITSTHPSGALTIRFASDPSVPLAGWAADVTCVVPCTGIPAPGATTTTESVVCPGVPFTLGTSNELPFEGLSYIWQSGPTFAGPWTTIASGPSSTYTVASQSVNTWYRVRVNCSFSGQTGVASSVQVSMAPVCYPFPPAPFFAADTDLGEVTVGTGTSITDCVTPGPGAGSVVGVYSSFLNQPSFTNLVRGGTAGFNIARQQCGPFGPYSSNAAIYIDFDQSGTFELSEEVYDAGQLTTTPYSGTFNIPVTATLGQTGMRVIAAESFTDITPDLVFNWGEVEDYIVTIVNPAVPNDFQALATNVVTGAFPTCSTNFTADLALATDSPETAGAGNDAWYTFSAVTNAVRIQVTGATDNRIELYDGATLIASEDDVVANGNETLVFDGLTPSNQYFVAVIANGTASAATTCISHLRQSGCSAPSTGFPATFTSPCQQFKSIFTGASSYTAYFDVDATAPFDGVSVSTPGTTYHPITSFVGLPPLTGPATYQVAVDATYNLLDAAGNPVTAVVPGTFNCSRNVVAHADVFLRNTDASPNVKPANAQIAANIWLCGAVNYQWTLQQYDAVGGNPVAPVPTTVNGPNGSRFLNLGPLALLPNGIYKVNVTPIFPTGTGNTGSDRWLIIAGPAPMILDGNQAEAYERTAEEPMIESALYPNPSNGSFVNLNITGIEANVIVRVLDGMGRVVWTNNLVVEGSLNTVIGFERPLASGLYTVEMTYDGKVITERLMVQK